MNCKAILRKSSRAGQQCTNNATRGGWCKVHDPLFVLPKLEGKRARIAASLRKVESEIEIIHRLDEPIENAS